MSLVLFEFSKKLFVVAQFCSPSRTVYMRLAAILYTLKHCTVIGVFIYILTLSCISKVMK